VHANEAVSPRTTTKYRRHYVSDSYARYDPISNLRVVNRRTERQNEILFAGLSGPRRGAVVSTVLVGKFRDAFN